jgi:hypothetical protein
MAVSDAPRFRTPKDVNFPFYESSAHGPNTDSTISNQESLRAYRVLLGIVTFLLCFPIWFVKYVPLVDYPNHLARCYILTNLGQVDLFRAFYEIRMDPIPNLAADLALLPFLQLFSVETSGRMFLTLVVLLFIFGTHELIKSVQGRPGWVAILSSFFIYNSMLFQGYINYSLSLGVTLLALAFWIRYRKSWTPLKFLLVSALITISYLSHLSGYIISGYIVLLILIQDIYFGERQINRLLLSLLPHTFPLIPFLLFMKGSGEVGKVVWSSPLHKAGKMFVLITGYNYTLDAAVGIIFAACCLLMLLFSRRVSLNGAILVVGVGLFILFILLPSWLFTAGDADVRVIPYLAIFVFAAFRIRLPSILAKACFLLILSAFLLRLGVVCYTWASVDSRIAAQVKFFERFEEGSRVFPIVTPQQGLQNDKMARIFRHVIHYSTINRYTFSPTLFALKGSHPLNFKESQPLNKKVDILPFTPSDWQRVFSDHDYIWLYSPDGSIPAQVSSNTELVAREGYGYIFRPKAAK